MIEMPGNNGKVSYKKGQQDNGRIIDDLRGRIIDGFDSLIINEAHAQFLFRDSLRVRCLESITVKWDGSQHGRDFNYYWQQQHRVQGKSCTNLIENKNVYV